MQATSAETVHQSSSSANRLHRTNVSPEKVKISHRDPFYSQSQSSFQSNNLELNQLEQLNQSHTSQPRRTRVRWTHRQRSFYPSSALSNSMIDFSSPPLLDPSVNEELLATNIEIREMTTKDFEDEYKKSLDEKGQNQTESTVTTVPIVIVSSDDDDEPDDHDEEIIKAKKINGQTDPNKSTVESPSIGLKTKKKSKSPTTKKKSSPTPQRNKSTGSGLNTQASSSSSSSAAPQITPSTESHTVSPSLQKSTPSAPTRSEEPTILKPFVTVDTSRARSNLEVVRLCLKELGWKECTSSSIMDADIYWHSSSFHENNANFSTASGRVNKFPCMSDLLRKIHLTRSLNHMRVLFPHEYSFYPQTWFLPEQDQQFKDDVRYIHQQDRKHQRSLTTFIVKPSDGSQGEGIYLLRDPSHMINTSRPHVIQEYIDRPLLIDGLKFDLRIYVLILNLYPLEIFLYDEGLVRFATVDYKAPSIENLHQTYMHLTNYSLNKRSSTYKHASSDQQNDGSKRKLSAVWQQLTAVFGASRIERTKSLVVDLINKTILAIVPEMRVEYQHELPTSKQQSLSCFQIVGFDIILDDQLKPILLEVNSNPSLRIDFDKPNEFGKTVYEPSPIDEEIKKPLVLESLKLALPKKKLETIVRHVQSQVNEEILAQRLEKLAQRRVEERLEKIRSARTSRFDIKSNPFFSRPVEGVAKEVERQQQELERYRVHSPTEPTVFLRFNGVYPTTVERQPTPLPSRSSSMKKVKKAHYELAASVPTSKSSDDTRRLLRRSSSRKQSSVVSFSTRPSAMSASFFTPTNTEDTPMIPTVKLMKLIFPDPQKKQYEHLFLIDQISFIYIQLAVLSGQKTMTGGQFRNFASVCGILSETITSSSIDILYYQILRKWQQFVLRNPTPGLPFSAFVEAFFLLSQRKFPNASSLLDSVNRLVQHSTRHLNSAISNSSGTTIPQSNATIVMRSARNSTSASTRQNSSIRRSPTMVSTQRNSTSPTLIQRNRLLSLNQSALPSQKSKAKESTRSVFPLFFDVL